MTFGQRISSLRKEAGLSQEALAEQLGVSRQAIGKWESGNSLPSIENLKELAVCLNVSVDEILSGKDSERAAEEIRQKVSDGAAEEISQKESNGAGDFDSVATLRLDSVKALLEEQEQLRRQRDKKKFRGLLAGTIIAAVLLVIAGTYYMERLNHLQNTVREVQRDLSDMQGTMQGYLGSLRSEIEEGLQQQASLLSDHQYSIGRYDPEKQQAELVVTAVLKSYREEMSVSFVLQPMVDSGDTLENPVVQEAVLQRDGTYRAEFWVPMVQDFTIGMKIDDGETVSTETMERVYGFSSNYQNVVEVSSETFSFSVMNRTLRIGDGTVGVTVYPAPAEGVPPIEEVSMKMYQGETLLYEESMGTEEIYGWEEKENANAPDQAAMAGGAFTLYLGGQLTGRSFTLPEEYPEGPDIRVEITVRDTAGEEQRETMEW